MFFLPKPYYMKQTPQLQDGKNFFINYLPPKKKKKIEPWFFHFLSYKFLLVLKKCSSLLAFPCPPLASCATSTIVPKISIIENQWQVIAFFTIILICGNTDARTSFQRREKGGGDTIDEPHSHPIKLATPGWAVARRRRGGQGPWLNRFGLKIEAGRTACRGSGGGHEF